MSAPTDRDEDFAALLEESESTPGDVFVSPGDTVEGEIVLITDECLFIDYGGKAEGWTERAEFTAEDGSLTVAVGERVTLRVLEINRGGVHLGTRLRRNVDTQGDWSVAQEAFESETPIDGVVTATNKGGFDVNLSGLRAFCPVSQIDTEYCEEPETFVGQSLTFRIVECDEEDKRLVVSRRQHLEAERAILAVETRKNLAVGDVVEGRVRQVKPFGVFVEFGGLDGFVHISELSRRRVENPSDVVTRGDTIRAQVISIATDDKGKERIGLSLKALEPDPWVDGLPVSAGDVVQGRVRHLESFGAFVELAPGLDGLVHISEIARERLAHPSERLSVGETVTVLIKDIDTERRRLLLSIRGASEEAATPESPDADAEAETRIRHGNVIRRHKGGSPAPSSEGAEAETALAANEQWAALDDAKRDEPVRPAAEAVEPEEKSAPAAAVTTPRIGLVTVGRVASIMPYGAFIDLTECGENARGLCHRSELAAQEQDDPFRGLVEGQDLEVEIIRIDEKGRLGLSHRAVAIRRERQEVEAAQRKHASPGSLQSLGDLLKGLKIEKK